MTIDLVNRVFGTQGQANFCSGDGQCGIDAGQWSRADCRKSIVEMSACVRRRPDMIIFICADSFFEMILEKFGRSALILRVEDTANEEKISSVIKNLNPIISKVRQYIANLPRDKIVSKLPMVNFQAIGGHEIARKAQDDLQNFENIMNSLHDVLYNADYRNPQKSYMRGAYMLDARIGFQRDRLHDYAQFGLASRNDGYHLINAHYLFGVPIKPGEHFDVTSSDGRALRQIFQDVVTRQKTKKSSLHVNVTPDDRLIGNE
ncbi:hypothetical protein OSJ57_22420 [Sphingomonas sp. HH69]